MRTRKPALAALALAVAACGPGGMQALAPEDAYRARTCYRCHGADRSGTEIGPPLAGLAGHWNVDSLTAYLDDPERFQDRDERLGRLVAEYNGKRMRRIDMPPGEGRRLAAWLLGAGETGAGPVQVP